MSVRYIHTYILLEVLEHLRVLIPTVSPGAGPCQVLRDDCMCTIAESSVGQHWFSKTATYIRVAFLMLSKYQ